MRVNAQEGAAELGGGTQAGAADQGGAQGTLRKAGPEKRRGQYGGGTSLWNQRLQSHASAGLRARPRSERRYSQVQLAGEKIPNNVNRTLSDNKALSDEELRRATKRGGNNKSNGDSSMWIEDLKDWLVDAEQDEEAEKEGEK